MKYITRKCHAFNDNKVSHPCQRERHHANNAVKADRRTYGNTIKDYKYYPKKMKNNEWINEAK